MKRIFFSGSLAVAALLQACAPAPQQTPAADAGGALTQNYMDAAQALYADDFDKAKGLLAAFAGESSGEVKTLAQAAADAADLPSMRSTFRELSELAAKMELPAEYAVAYCPMYKSGMRAHWVQKKGPLTNPYFGKSDAMAGCGTFVN
jgi:hypothetical protein